MGRISAEGQACTLISAVNDAPVCARYVLDRQSLMLHILQVILENQNDTMTQGWIFSPV
jgi:hypothetical protein